MLRQVHFYRKGALRSFAAPSTKVTNADKATLVGSIANGRFSDVALAVK